MLSFQLDQVEKKNEVRKTSERVLRVLLTGYWFRAFVVLGPLFFCDSLYINWLSDELLTRHVCRVE